MNSFELTAMITAVANAIAFRLTDDEINLLVVILDQLSDTLSTIVTVRSGCIEQSIGGIKDSVAEYTSQKDIFRGGYEKTNRTLAVDGLCSDFARRYAITFSIRMAR